MGYIRITEELFSDLWLYHIAGMDEPGERIKTELIRKMEAMRRRDCFAAYKTATDEAERERARRAYLDSAGIQHDFRS